MMETTVARRQLKDLPIEQLVKGKYQPRHDFDETKLHELAETFKQVGILSPLLVRPKEAGCYEIIAGERRWRAAQLAQLEVVPCLIGDYTDQQALLIGFIENDARQELNPMEQANALNRMVNEFQYTHEEIALIIGKSRSEVTNILRLLKLDERVRLLVASKKLTESNARLLASLPTADQFPLAKKAIAKGWASRALESAVQQYKKERNVSLSSHTASADSKHFESQLSEYLGYPVTLDMKNKQQGHLKIQFYSLAELDGILEKIGYQHDSD